MNNRFDNRQVNDFFVYQEVMRTYKKQFLLLPKFSQLQFANYNSITA